jgi:hypothetical protein
MVVVAAGNDGLNISASGTDASGYGYDGQYPAKFAALYLDCVLAVAAVDSSDRLATFSNWGNAVGIAAPGKGLLYSGEVNAAAFCCMRTAVQRDRRRLFCLQPLHGLRCIESTDNVHPAASACCLL